MCIKGNRIKLSIIIPIFNEEKSIKILYYRIKGILTALEEKSEIIFIDDGSSDSSREMLKHLSTIDRCVRVFGFNSNKGQHKALEKGFHEAQGEVIVTMDGDLQNDPGDIPKLIAKLNEGFDAVCGWRRDRKDSWYKILCMKLGNYIQRKITKVNLHDIGCGMRAYRKEIIKDLVIKNRYEIGLLPCILSKYTSRIAEMSVMHNKRRYGRSKYGFSYIFGTVYCYIKLILTKNNKLENPSY